MADDGRAATYLGMGLILLLLAVGGWGAFAYSLYAAHQDTRLLRDEVDRLTAEREQLTSDLTYMAAEVTRWRAEHERIRQALERTQADLIAAQAEVAAMKAQPPSAEPPSLRSVSPEPAPTRRRSSPRR